MIGSRFVIPLMFVVVVAAVANTERVCILTTMTNYYRNVVYMSVYSATVPTEGEVVHEGG